MTSDQYTELVGFLGGRFDRIDGQFDRIDRQFDRTDRQFEDARREREEIREEARRHATALFEQSQTSLKVLAEGLGLRIERVENGLFVLAGRMESLEGSVTALDHRVGSLEGAVEATVS